MVTNRGDNIKTTCKKQALIYLEIGEVTEEVAQKVRDFPSGYPERVEVELEIDTDTYDYGPKKDWFDPGKMSDEEKVSLIVDRINDELSWISHATTESRQEFILFDEEMRGTWEEPSDIIVPFIEAVKERMNELGIDKGTIAWVDE